MNPLRHSKTFLLQLVTVLLIASPVLSQITVTNTNDSGAGSLRQAITDANSNPDTTLIDFNIPGVGPHTIQPTSLLPIILTPIIIDGTTEPDYVSTPVIELDGSNSGAGTTGFRIDLAGSGSTIRGLAINQWPISGILLNASNGNTIESCFIGTDPTGTIDRGNVTNGITITGPNNTIGGTATGAGNLISGNDSDGIEISGASATGNQILGNLIGTDINGTTALGNGPNSGGAGISIVSTSSTTVGGTTAAARNIISGNQGIGVNIGGGSNNTVQGNYIGLDINGTTALANTDGIQLQSATTGNAIGGTAPGAGNVISGNGSDGIQIFTNASSNTIAGNYIGLNAAGTAAVGNTSTGVHLLLGDNNTVGPDNVISGHINGNGVAITSTSSGNIVKGNLIGTNPAGTAAIGNQGGIAIGSGASNTTIGGTTPADRNIISGSTLRGIYIVSGSHATQIQGNYIGTDINGTAGIPNNYGILISSSDSTTIGGTAANTGNIIAFNTGKGISLAGSATETAILQNAIHSNGDLGIDLADNGVTANDAGDGDTGVNNLQNFPVLTAAITGSITIQGTLNSAPNETFRIEFFDNDTSDVSGHGEGQTYLGFTNVNTNGSGDANINISFPNTIPIGHFITATATDANNNTSEFALAKIVTPPLLTLVAPDTTAPYSSSIAVPLRLEDATGSGIVAAEVSIAYDNTIVTPSSPNKTEILGTLVAAGWSVEENVLPGSGTIDTLSIAMSTAQDTINADGTLILLNFDTPNIRQPASTALELVHVLFNDGTPAASSQNGSIALTGTDGTITASPDSINPGDVVSITVTDIDLDLDVGNPDQVSATAISKGYNDSQTVTLTETGANTGIFTGSVNTLFALAAGPSEDGVITTIAGDSICVSFSDVLTSVGTTVTRYDTVEVIGGTDGEVLASFVVQSLDGRNGVRDTVRVQVTDSDLDTDVGVAEQVSATITNNVSGETEAVTLTETGVNTGIFQVRVPTISGASGTNNDGELSLASQDTLRTTYVDALTSQGGSSPIQDNTQVVNLFGDVRSNDNVQAFDAASILAHAVSLNTYTARDSLLGDVDGNNDIQAFDASQVLQYVVRLINRFPVQTDGTLNPPADPKNHPFLKPVPLNHIIALGELQPQGDGTHVMPISLTDRDGILSATLELSHSEHIQILDVTTDAAYNSFMVTHNAKKDRVRIAFAGAQSNTSGSGNVLYLHIKATGELQFSLDHIALNGHTLTPAAPFAVISQIEPVTPLVYALHQNQPNPFNPDTVIRYDLPETSNIRLAIYNVMGQQVRTLISDVQDAGAHQIIWNAKDDFGRQVSSGIYFLRMETENFKQTRKMLLLK